MSINLSSVIDNIHPAASGIGIITNDQIWVLFDREIDETTLAAGNFFVTGPDFDTWIGPDLQLFHEAEGAGSGSGDILESPGFEGLVQGTLSFERISNNSLDVVTDLDTVGSGFLYRTKAIFTPTTRLQSDTEYTVYLSGDEDTTNTLDTGISFRTVFDPVASGTNTGTGSASFEGGYTGDLNDIFKVTITTAGSVDEAKFVFERAIDPLSVFGPFRTRRDDILLSDGVSVSFEEGTYDLGDAWQSTVKARTTVSGNLFWPFKTGSGSIQTIPEDTSTTVIGDLPITTDTSSSSSTSLLSVLSTSPSNGATNVDVFSGGDYLVTVEFDKNIDVTTVVSGVAVTATRENVTGEVDSNTGSIIVLPTASGSSLDIAIGSGQLNQNNLVQLTIDNSIKATDGTSLSSDYTFEFSTTYSPLYCTVRRLRLMIGAFIGSVPDDTLNMAIHIASLEAGQLTWNKNAADTEYYKFVRQEWTCCRAAEILLMNVTGGSGNLKSKRLGDLQVEYDNSSQNINHALERAMECQAKWEGALIAGGAQVQRPGVVVKGAADPDRPAVGRLWHHNRSFSTPQTPSVNRKVLPSGHRRYKHISIRPGWRGK